jgi:hypothetical protein
MLLVRFLAVETKFRIQQETEQRHEDDCFRADRGSLKPPAVQLAAIHLCETCRPSPLVMSPSAGCSEFQTYFLFDKVCFSLYCCLFPAK